MTTVERDIMFFRVDTGNEPNGKPKAFNPEKICSYINSLPFDQNSPIRRYWEDNDRILACWVDSATMPCKIRLGNIRRSELPQVEQQGELSPLEISEQAGLVEQTHIVFLTEEIIGCDKNFYGPRISRLPFYLSEKATVIAPETMNISAILKRDVYKQLKAYKHITVFNLRINASYIEVLKDIDISLSSALQGALNVGESDDLEIILKMTRRSKGWLAERLLDDVKGIIRQKDFLFDVRKMKIKGYNASDQKVVALDLLSDKLFVRKGILKVERRSKALNPKSAYKAILDAFHEKEEEILESASIRL